MVLSSVGVMFSGFTNLLFSSNTGVPNSSCMFFLSFRSLYILLIIFEKKY